MSDQKIIMVVGPDMCGKTQIAQALAKDQNIGYFKATSEHETYLSMKERFLLQLQHADPRTLDLLKQIGFSAVFDRAYPCEFAYSRVFKRKTDNNKLVMLDREYAKLGAKIILCRRTSYKGIVDDIDPHITSTILEDLDRAYNEFCGWTRCDVLQLNVDDENIQRELTDIKNWLLLK